MQRLNNIQFVPYLVLNLSSDNGEMFLFVSFAQFYSISNNRKITEKSRLHMQILNENTFADAGFNILNIGCHLSVKT